MLKLVTLAKGSITWQKGRFGENTIISNIDIGKLYNNLTILYFIIHYFIIRKISVVFFNFIFISIRFTKSGVQK